jgi:hypothetical protein
VFSIVKKLHILYEQEPRKKIREKITHEKDMITIESMLAAFLLFSWLVSYTNSGDLLGLANSGDMMIASLALLLCYTIAILLAKVGMFKEILDKCVGR